MSGLEPVAIAAAAGAAIEVTNKVLMPVLLKRTRVGRLKKGLLHTQEAVQDLIEHQKDIEGPVFEGFYLQLADLMKGFDKLESRKRGWTPKYLYCLVTDAAAFTKECLHFKLQVRRSSLEAEVQAKSASRPSMPGMSVPPSVTIGPGTISIVHPTQIGLDGNQLQAMLDRFGCTPVQPNVGPAACNFAVSLQPPSPVTENVGLTPGVNAAPQSVNDASDDNEEEIRLIVAMDREIASIAADLAEAGAAISSDSENAE